MGSRHFSLIFAAPALLACLAAAPVTAAQFPGDDVLSITNMPWKAVTRDLIKTRLDLLFSHLNVKKEKLARFEYARTAQLAEASEFVNIGEITNTILVARKGAEIAHARNTIVISQGPVKIAFASGVLVIAAGSINISHENDEAWGKTLPADGFYLTKRDVHISFAQSAIIYAVQGADISHGGPLTVYNTNIKHDVATINRVRSNYIFRNEPTR